MLVRTILVSFGVFTLFVPGSSVGAEGAAPEPASPGSQLQEETVAESCPTFSWSAVVGARGYTLVVYEVTGSGELGRAVVRQRLAVGVSSWTPPLSRGLEPGGRYAWSVGAVTDKGETQWSEPAFFRVAAGPSAAEFEEALRIVRSYLATREVAIQETPSLAELEPTTEPPGISAELPNPLAPPPGTQMSVDGNVDATSFSGGGALLTGLDPASLSPGTAAIDISGTAATASNLVGGASVSVAELEFDPATQTEMDAHASAADAHREHASLEESAEIDSDIATHAGLANAHHTPPTGLPPTGPAGGELTGTYPNPGVAASIARDSEVTSEIASHAGLPNVHHTPTVDTVLTEAQVEGYVTDDPLDMGNNAITNIGAAGTDFTATGGLRIADDLRLDGDLGIGIDPVATTNAHIYLYDGGIFSGPYMEISGHNRARVRLERRRTDGGWYQLDAGCDTVNCANDFQITHSSAGSCLRIRDGCELEIPKLELTSTDSPDTCTGTTEGRVYYDASLSEPCFCNGTSWTQFDGGGAC